jgi:hypothetical protein
VVVAAAGMTRSTILTNSSWARRRLLVVGALFALAIAGSLVDWYRHPPVLGDDGQLLNMKNGPGDLSFVLWCYVVESAIVVAALQPWRTWPRRRWITLTAIAFGLLNGLRMMIGLHSPTVMFGHDVLVLILAAYLIGVAMTLNEAPRST